MDLQKNVVPRSQYCGQVKVTGFGSVVISRYKSGWLELIQNDRGQCCITVREKVARGLRPEHTFRLNENTIKKLIAKPNMFVLELISGVNIFLKDFNNSKIMELKVFIDQIQKKKITSLSCQGIPTTPKIGTPTDSFQLLRHSTPVNRTKLNLNIFEDKDEPDCAELKDDSYNCPSSNSICLFEDHSSNSDNNSSRLVSKDYLNRGSSLAAVVAGKFYGQSIPTASNKDDLPTENYRPPIHMKRKPRLLDQSPTPKKQRLNFNFFSYSWSKKAQPLSQKQTSLQGFSNLGNTCYMNAILQSLYCLDTFVSDLTRNVNVIEWPKNTLFRGLVKLWKLKKTQHADVIEKDNCLRQIKFAISSSAKRFSGFQQQDAHELLNLVMDQLKEEVIKFKKSSNPLREYQCIKFNELTNPTILNFELEILHMIRCRSCDSEKTVREHFNDLSVEFRRSRDGQQVSLQEALLFSLRSETIDYKCEDCGCSRARVSHLITKVPRVLILHLKRFSYINGKYQKIGHPIVIPKYVTLLPVCDNESREPHPFQSSVLQDDSENSYNFKSFSPKKQSHSLKFSKHKEESDFINAINESKKEACALKMEQDDIQKALELSKNSTPAYVSCHKDIEQMTEEDQIRLAMELSLSESNLPEEMEDISYDVNSSSTTCNGNHYSEATKLCFEDSVADNSSRLFEDMKASSGDVDYRGKTRDGVEPTRVFESPEPEEDEDNLDDVYDPDILQIIHKNTRCGDQPLSYRLMSVVSHRGDSSKSGHYISDVYSILNDVWFSYDDKYSEKISESEVLKNRERDGYIFFYMNLLTVNEVNNRIKNPKNRRDNTLFT